MKRNIIVQNDSESITLSVTSEPDVYRLTVRQDEFSPFIVDVTDSELRELKYLIDEILQLANKRDY